MSLPVNARQVSPQPCALCHSGGLRVHATARRMHIRRRVAVLRSPPRLASVCSAGGGETCRPWHLGCSSRLRPVSASLPLPASPLPSPPRRFAPRCFVGRIQPPRLAACSAAHATNRVAACRSARRSTPRVASSASNRCAFSARFCAASPLAAPLSVGVPAQGASRRRRPDASPMRVSACGVLWAVASIRSGDRPQGRSRRVLRGELAPGDGLALS